MKTFIAAALAGYATASDHWAVLVAGSNTYSNYRHQADVAHAYTILRGQGIPAENIIYMAYDEVADNSRNPLKGQLFNKTDGKTSMTPPSLTTREQMLPPRNSSP